VPAIREESHEATHPGIDACSGRLERSLAFYRDGLGLETKGITGQQFEYGAVVFFRLDDGLILALWPASSLSRDAAIEATTNRLGAVSIGHLVDSKAEVDALVREAESAGAVVTDLRSVSPRARAVLPPPARSR
jgi:catechol 2,3-dioxygenase-like lactoylglutathione lyase family enzyme